MHGAADQSHSSHRSEPAGRTGSVDKSVRSRLAKSLTLGGISLGYAVVQLDVTTVNTALSSVGNSLGGGVSELQWVVTAYTIAFAALILTAGALGDRFCAKRIFMAGFASHACLPQSRRSRVTASGRSASRTPHLFTCMSASRSPRGRSSKKLRQCTRRRPTPGSRRVPTIDFGAASPIGAGAAPKNSVPRPEGQTSSS